MYESFYGLTCEPFSVAADPRFFFKSPIHRQARAHLRHGLRRGAGFLLLSGEIGAGKTTVCRLFLKELPETVDVAFVVNPRLDARALLIRVCEDLRIQSPEGAVDLIDLIHGHVLLAHAAGRRTLIVVDEAQALSFDVFEQLRLLTNLDATGSKLQVFLIGQPELRALLRNPALEAVAQRVVSRFHLSALTEAQTAAYITHRLTVAGLVGAVPFDAPALQAIHDLTDGVPRRINVLCDQALVAAEASGTREINREMVERVAAEAFDIAPPEAPPAASQVPAAPRAVHADSAGLRWSRYAAIAVGAVVLGALLERGRFATTPTEGASPRSDSVVLQNPPAALIAPAAAVGSIVPEQSVLPGESPQDGMGTFAALFDTGTDDESPAWRSLARLWGVKLGPGKPCTGASSLGLRCYRTNGGLAIIRQLDRPGILKLINDNGRVSDVLLVGLTNTTAMFRGWEGQQTIPLSSLAGHWHGEFAILWRPPPGYHPGESNHDWNAVTAWMGQRLAIIDGSPSTPVMGEALGARIEALQLAHGLQPDGLAGPLTLMQLNRDSGIDEPRLIVEP